MTLGPGVRIARRTDHRMIRRETTSSPVASRREPEPAPSSTPTTAPSPEGIEGRLKQVAALDSSGDVADNELSQAKAKLLSG